MAIDQNTTISTATSKGGGSAMFSMVMNTTANTPQGVVGDDTSNTSKLVRLVVDPDVQSHMEFDEISTYDFGSNHDVQGNSEKSEIMGVGYPVIRINDMVIDKKNITSMKIGMSGFLPTISIQLTFIDNTFMTKNAPKDGDLISLFMRTSSSEVAYIRAEFLIDGCKSDMSRGGCTVRIGGHLFIPGFESSYGTKAYVGSSKTAIRSIAKDFGLGFAFNDYDDTDDYQSWIRCNEPYDRFIENIVSHAWKNETSFFGCWVDLYYNLCYSNVNKFLLTSENPDDVDVTFGTKTLNVFNASKQTTGEDNTPGAVKVLSNTSDAKGTPFYILKWKPYNTSSSTSLSVGYSRESYSFLHNPNLASSDDEKYFERLLNIPAYDQNKVDSYVLLRGRCKYDPKENPSNEMERVNHDYVNTYIQKSWSGVEYVMSDSDAKKSPNQWSGNVHRNYRRAPEHNKINRAELDKIYITVECEGLCLQIMRGEKVPVYLILGDTVEQNIYNMKDENKPDAERDVDRFYTGYYIVDSIMYTYNPLGTESSPFRTNFVLKRREWPTPEQI